MVLPYFSPYFCEKNITIYFAYSKEKSAIDKLLEHLSGGAKEKIEPKIYEELATCQTYELRKKLYSDFNFMFFHREKINSTIWDLMRLKRKYCNEEINRNDLLKVADTVRSNCLRRESESDSKRHMKKCLDNLAYTLDLAGKNGAIIKNKEDNVTNSKVADLGIKYGSLELTNVIRKYGQE